MVAFWCSAFFIVGAIFGSFLNVVGLRLPQHQNFVSKRSACPLCQQTLLWYELIPFASYLVQKGRCRSCGHSISPLYPFIEFTSGFLFLFAYLKIGFQIELISAVLLISLSIILIVCDLRYMIIPNRVLGFFLPLFILFNLIEPLNPWHDAIIGSLSGFVLVGLIIFLSKGGMGAGDMKLLALLGLMLGLKKVLLTFFIAVCLGAVIGMGLLATRTIHRKQPIPFAPYILIGALASYFYGTELITLYTGIIRGSFY